MTLGTFAIPASLVASKANEQRVLAVSPNLGVWISVVPIGNYRSGVSIISYPESFDVATKSGLLRINARACTIAIGENTPRHLPEELCLARSGFKAAALRSLDSSTAPGAEVHRQYARKSEIPDDYTAIVGVLASFHTDEIAVRQRPRPQQDHAMWTVIGSSGNVVESLIVPQDYHLIAFSRTQFVAVKPSQDGQASGAWLAYSFR